MKQAKHVENLIREFDQMMANVSPTGQTSKDSGLIFHRVTAEQLKAIGFDETSGDALTPSGSHHHQGSPDTLDHNRFTKRMVYEAASSNDMKLFNRLEKVLNTESTWLEWMVSKRHLVPSKIPGKEPRPIDVPSEAKRLYGILTLWHLTQVVKAADYLEPTVIGFRFVHEFLKYKDRQDGITIQDVFADTVQGLISQYGSWVTFIDLKDAYGNLPHQAIQAALRELGINHTERRRLIELVRIRTIKPDGKPYRPRKYGIEQGHPASPMVFNIVMSHIVKKLKSKGIPTASYGDDIVLVTNSESGANQAYGAFYKITQDLGFKNVRPLGTEGKASRIYNVAIEPVPLIKTFEVGIGHIGLSDDKTARLIKALSPEPSLNEIRRKNKYKMVSKRFLKTILNKVIDPNPPAGVSSDLLYVNPYREGRTEGGCHKEGDRPLVSHNKNRSISLTNVPGRETDSMDNLTILSDKVNGLGMEGSSPYGDSSVPAYSSTSKTPTSTNSTGQPAGQELSGMTSNGRGSVSRDGSDSGVTLSKKDVGGVGHHIPASEPVLFRPTVEDWNLLTAGRRLPNDGHYRECTVDLRELADKVPSNRMPHAIAQLARLASWKGQARFLVHPGDSWVWDEVNFPSLYKLGTKHHPKGMVLTFRQPTVKTKGEIEPRKVRSAPPEADFVILSARRFRDDARKWSVKLVANGNRQAVTVKTLSPDIPIGRLEAVSRVLVDRPSMKVAMPFSGLVKACLLKTGKPRQVGLADAVKILKRWKWNRNGGWVVGVTTNK